MVTLRRIGIFSATRVGFLFGLATGIVQVTTFLVFMIISGVNIGEIPGGFWQAVAFSILMSSVFLGAILTMFAVLYNTGFGSLQLEFDRPVGSVEKRKNGEFIDEDDIEEID